MSAPSFSAWPDIPSRSAPEADFDTKMYALFNHFATTHRNEMLAFISWLQTNSTIIGGALNGTTLGLTTPAAGKFTQATIEQQAGSPSLLLVGALGYNVSLKFSVEGSDAWSVIGSQTGSLAFYDFAGLTTPVQFEAGAVANTFVVDAASRIGIGTPSPTMKLGILQSESGVGGFNLSCTSTAFAATGHNISISTAASASFNFMTAYSSGGTLAFKVRGDGEVSATGAFTTIGADYGEYFEWLDGNTAAEDRRGLSVVLDGGLIRPALAGETPVGVVSANASVIGDADAGYWTGKYLRDDFGSYLMEPYSAVEWVETVNQGTEERPDYVEVPHSYAADEVPTGVTVLADAVVILRERRQINPAFDPALTYVPRGDRPEWEVIGLKGKLRVLKGQPVAPGWIKMRDVSATVEEWLVL
ncbi:peptidase G2 autoproteolytic cleavage domain-containing protein [Pseudodonghicola flavimaris]|uniref:Peptidase G2 autoproteolytic cleavage domain-containing protein n=1 Tax=Pseudodonghicola flavimaris TaxID=3050036 RepID=A0ABT7EZE7_9RHOB|nr:peptidase G2 autoproteolytic cleavage domain-containing protein [Pseudodonghicola flavimaris]MDK3017630.1 peptidase G2 autoproteolytic cleavage domain-containing protein [Pseudodonghicola flavimaris]